MADSVGTVVVEELKKQARAEGYVVFAFPRADVEAYWIYALGVFLGFMLAGGARA